MQSSDGGAAKLSASTVHNFRGEKRCSTCSKRFSHSATYFSHMANRKCVQSAPAAAAATNSFDASAQSNAALSSRSQQQQQEQHQQQFLNSLAQFHQSTPVSSAASPAGSSSLTGALPNSASAAAANQRISNFLAASTAATTPSSANPLDAVYLSLLNNICLLQQNFSMSLVDNLVRAASALNISPKLQPVQLAGSHNPGLQQQQQQQSGNDFANFLANSNSQPSCSSEPSKNNKTADEELTKLREEFASARKDFESFKAKCSEDNENLKSQMTGELAKHSEQITTLKEEIENLKAVTDKKTGELTKANLEIATLRQESDKLKAQNSHLTEEIAKQSEQLTGQQATKESLKATNLVMGCCKSAADATDSSLAEDVTLNGLGNDDFDDNKENNGCHNNSDLIQGDLVIDLSKGFEILKTARLHQTTSHVPKIEEAKRQDVVCLKSDKVNGKPTSSTISAQIHSPSLHVKEIRSDASTPSSREKSSPSAFLEEMTDWDWFKAVMNGDLEKVKDFVDRGFNCNTKNEDHNSLTALHYCAKNDSRKHLDMARLLLEHGADVEAVDRYKETPLIAACYNGKLDACQLLIKHGANVNAMDQLWNTPLISAAVAGAEEIVTILAEHPQFNTFNHKNQYGKTALNKAFDRGHLTVVHVLKGIADAISEI